MDVWEDTKSLAHRLKIERSLNFTTMAHEEDDYSSYSQKKIARDPMSHRIIEKRRRDRMNNCLADLSRLIPATYLKKGRGRIEKTEIIEMATKHLRHLQAHACKDPATCEVSLQQQQRDEASSRRMDDVRRQEEVALQRQREQHRLGFQECSSETVRFLVEAEGFYPGQGVCLRLLHHLQQHYDKLVQGMCYMVDDHHGDHRNDKRDQSQMTNGHGHQDDNNMLQLDCNSNQSLCESYAKQTSNLSSQMNIGGHPRSLKRSSSQMSDCPSNSVEVLRLNNSVTDRLGSVSVRTDEEMDDDHSIVGGNYGVHPAAIERPVSARSPRLHPQLAAIGHSRSHLRDILNQDSCPASYEQKRIRSNSIDSARSCKTTTGVVSSHTGYPSSDIYSNRTAEEVYKFKNNIKERFRADILHHNFDSTTAPSSHESMVAPASSSHNHQDTGDCGSSHNHQDTYSKLPTGESFGISRMFPSMSGGAGNGPSERSFATLNGFGAFGVNGDLPVKIPSEATRPTRKDSMQPDESGNACAGNGGEHRSSRSSSCNSNQSPNSMSSNCFANHASSSHGTRVSSGADGSKCASSVGHSSTSGYSTSGEGSSTVSTCNKTTRNSSLSSGSPVPSRNNTGENSPNCGLLKIEDHQSPNSSSQSPRPDVPVSLVPIFALHPKGTFYIPLHLDSATLTPLLRDRPYLLEREDTLPLHPVNISVCFYPGRSSACKDIRKENALLANWKAKNERESAYESYREQMY